MKEKRFFLVTEKTCERKKKRFMKAADNIHRTKMGLNDLSYKNQKMRLYKLPTNKIIVRFIQ